MTLTFSHFKSVGLDLTSILMKVKNSKGRATGSPLEVATEETLKSTTEDIPQKKRRIGRIMQVVLKTPQSL